jgi:hypothetical protein
MMKKRRNCLTVSELLKVLKDAEAAGNGNADVLFDSEAQTFGVHMVEVSSAYLEPAEHSPDGEAFLSLGYEFEGQVERRRSWPTDEELLTLVQAAKENESLGLEGAVFLALKALQDYMTDT